MTSSRRLIHNMCFAKQMRHRCQFALLVSLVLMIGVYTVLHTDILVINSGRALALPQYLQYLVQNPSVPLTIPDNDVSNDDHWQHVTSHSDVFVYSAYHEAHFNDRVRIIGVMADNRTTDPSDLYCVMWYGDVAKTVDIVRAIAVKINEGHFERFTATYFVCHLARSSVPERVSLVDEAHIHNPSINLLTVHRQSRHDTRQFYLTACVSPVYDDPDIKNNIQAERMIEWIETNRVLGLEFFTVYTHNASKDVTRVLKYYESVGLVEIRNWTHPAAPSSTSVTGSGSGQHPGKLMIDEIHYLGQLAALNDCLYRNKNRSAYTAAFDLDELIVPQNKEDFTLLDMLNRVPSKAAYLFRNTYFGKAGNFDHPRVMTFDFDLHMIDKFHRDRQIKEIYDKSKMIFKPNEIVTLGIHEVWAMLDGSEKYGVDPDIGMLHHYRKNVIRHPLTDKATGKYFDKVLRSINATYVAMQKFDKNS